MTNEQLAKAASVLLRADDQGNGILEGGKSFLPLVHMVGDEVCITFFSALRAQKNQWLMGGDKQPIEQVTIAEAWQFVEHGELPSYMKDKVDWNFDSNGYKKEGEDLLPWQKKRYINDPRVIAFLGRK